MKVRACQERQGNWRCEDENSRPDGVEGGARREASHPGTPGATGGRWASSAGQIWEQRLEGTKTERETPTGGRHTCQGGRRAETECARTEVGQANDTEAQEGTD